MSLPPPPRWAARAVLALAGLAAAALVGHPAGVGISTVAVALGAVAARRRPDRWGWAWWSAAALLGLVPVLRAATWVIAPCLAGALCLAALALGGRPAPVRGAARVLAAAELRLPKLRPAARGAALAALLLAVFVPLLVSADAAFAQLLHDAVFAGWPVDRTPARFVVAVGVLGAGGALLQRSQSPSREPAVALGRLDWALPPGALVAVFAAFVAVQLTTLFGGDRHVLRTAGLTYAQYARAGFDQLLVVAALTLAVIAAVRRWARRDRATDERLLRALLAALCALTLVVLASALRRLSLYEDAFGFTRARLAAEAVMLWLAALFCLLAAAGGRPWVPRAAVAISAAALLAFAAAIPTAWSPTATSTALRAPDASTWPTWAAWGPTRRPRSCGSRRRWRRAPPRACAPRSPVGTG